MPVCGIAGDQQAATIGQACFEPGMVKATYGTGCFALLNTGRQAVASRNRLLTTIAYQLDGVRTYALEGAIFVAGAAVQWLRDGLGVLADAAQSGALAARADPEQAVTLVPAFTGLGAPHWDPAARGALFGLTRATGPAELARAALESVAFQTRDLLEAMAADFGGRPAHRAARRWRHGRVGLGDAVSGRHPRLARRSAGGRGNNGARRRLSRGSRRRGLPAARRFRRPVAIAASLPAHDAGGGARAAICDLARRAAPHADGARIVRLLGVLLLLWSLFGGAVAVMMIYGVFDHVALNSPVMAAILASGTAFLAGIGMLFARRRAR